MYNQDTISTLKLKIMGDFNWAQFGGGAANTLLGTGMGLLLEGHNDRRQLEQQGKLQEQQIQGQKQMIDYSMMKQMEMWKNTNYGAQMEQIAAAGLNPALLYGKGGAGGTTTGSPSGNVQGATAPQGGMEVMNMMMARAQMGLIQAQTEKTKAEAGAIPTQIQKTTAEIGNIIADTESKIANTALTNINEQLAELEKTFQSDTLLNRTSIVNITLSKMLEEVRIIENDREISDATKMDKIRLIGTQITNIAADTLQKKKSLEKTDAEIAQIEQQITNLKQAWDINSLDQEMAKDGVNPNSGRIVKLFHNMIRGIAQIFGR